VNFFFKDHELRDLYEKVAADIRLTEADALRLFDSKDLNALAAMAEIVRRRKNANRASYIVNRYINYSNYCILSCQFCAFARKKRDGNGFELSVEEITAKAREALALGITELHIVGGVHPNKTFDWHLGIVRHLHTTFPRLHLKAFTAIEIRHLMWVGKRNLPDTLAALATVM